MKKLCTAILGGVLGLAGCTPASRSPDAIRQDTADATATAARDAKAVAQGVFDGLKHKGTVNINTAGKAELMTLPGVTSEMADRILANRPYASAEELEQRHLLTRAEFGRIADRTVAH